MSILVFFFENYVEETEAEGESRFSMLPYWSSSQQRQNDHGKFNKSIETFLGSVTASNNCDLVEPIRILKSCIQCTRFEKEALKTAYCAPSGYYNRIQCLKSGRIIQKPCYDSERKEAFKLKRFFLISLLCFITSFVFVKYRRDRVERRAYMKIQQSLEP
uniref:Protein JTB n=1 Tax=Syphacia muris TaxID=451379 RepID=A0A158R3W8_9BILA